MNKVFIDSNIWLYGIIETQDTNKKEISKRIIKDTKVTIISYQVINEIPYNLNNHFYIPLP